MCPGGSSCAGTCREFVRHLGPSTCPYTIAIRTLQFSLWLTMCLRLHQYVHISEHERLLEFPQSTVKAVYLVPALLEVLQGLPITCPQGLCPHQAQRQCLGSPWAWFGTSAMGGGFPLLASFSATAYNKLESHQFSPSKCFSLCTVIRKAWNSKVRETS